MYKIYTKNWCVPPFYTPKLWLIMKLTIILLFVSLLQVSASTLAQQITFKKNDATVKEIFKQITAQTGYNVLYSPDLVDVNTRMNVNFNHTGLTDVLNLVIDKHTEQYTIDNKNIL